MHCQGSPVQLLCVTSDLSPCFHLHLHYIRSQTTGSPICATLDHSLEVIFSFWCTHPHQIISFSQAHKLRVLCMHQIRTHQVGFKRKKKWSTKGPLHVCNAPCQDWCPNLITAQLGSSFFSSWPAVGPYSILGTDNRPVGLIFFLFLACSRPLVGSRSIGPTDNRPSGLINFYLFIYFVFVRGPQSGPFKFLARF
jgi:hypothetical protein